MEDRPASSARAWLPPLMGALAALILLFALLPHGIGVTSDCVDYFSTAGNLAENNGFLQHDGRPYASWPPLYPMLLVLGSWMNAGPETTALVLNMLSLFLMLWLALRWALLNLRNRLLAHWLGLAFLLHFAFWDVALHAWTEPLYNFMAMLFLLLLPRASRKDSWAALAGLALLAASAWLLRYVGLTLVTVGGIFFLFSGSMSWPRRIARAAVFGLIAAVPAVLWMIRNIRVMGEWAGERSPSSFGFLQNLSRLGKAAWWIVPESWGKVLPGMVLMILIAGILFLAFRGRGKPRRHLELRRALLLYSALYLALLLYSSTRYAFEAIHSRYLMPVLPPLLLWLSLWLDDRFTGLKAPAKNALIILLTLWLVFPAAVSTKMIERAREEGVDVFGAPEWTGWPLWDWLAGSPPEAILISNGADAVHYHTGLPVRLAPRRWIHSTSLAPTDELQDFATIFEEGRPVFYVWIADFPRTGARENYHSLEEVLERYRLEPIVAFPEGAVFMVLPRVTN